jgi:acetyltransferase EpsM
MIGIVGINPVAKLIIDLLQQHKLDVDVVLIDDDRKKLGKKYWGVRANYTLEEWKQEITLNKNKSGMLIALGENHLATKERIHEEFKNLVTFLSLKDISSVTAPDFIVKEGTVICKGALIGHEVSIGCNNLIWSGAVIEHNTEIGNSCYISPGVTVSGFVKIGKCTLVGSGAIILPEIIIGEHCIIGAGSVVTKNVPDRTVVAGNPAKIFKKTE